MTQNNQFLFHFVLVPIIQPVNILAIDSLYAAQTHAAW